MRERGKGEGGGGGGGEGGGGRGGEEGGDEGGACVPSIPLPLYLPLINQRQHRSLTCIGDPSLIVTLLPWECNNCTIIVIQIK